MPRWACVVCMTGTKENGRSAGRSVSYELADKCVAGLHSSYPQPANSTWPFGFAQALQQHSGSLQTICAAAWQEGQAISTLTWLSQWKRIALARASLKRGSKVVSFDFWSCMGITYSTLLKGARAYHASSVLLQAQAQLLWLCALLFFKAFWQSIHCDAGGLQQLSMFRSCR